MRQSTYSESNNSSANQEIPSLVRKLKIHYCVHKSTPYVLILNQINIVHVLPYHLFYFTNEAVGCDSRNDKLHAAMLRNISLYFQTVSFLAYYNRTLHAFLYTIMCVTCSNYAIHLCKCTSIMCWSVEIWNTALQRFIQPTRSFLCLGYDCFFRYPAVEKSQHPITLLSLCGGKKKQISDATCRK